MQRAHSGDFPDFTYRALKAGTVVAEVPLRVTGPNFKVNVNLNLAGQVAFADGTPVPETLSDICAFVRATLDLFESDLSDPAALELRRKIDLAHPPKPYMEPPPMRYGIAAQVAEPSKTP